MIEKKQRKDGSYYFIVKANNGQIVATSVDHDNEAARDNGIASLKRIIEREMFSEN